MLCLLPRARSVPAARLRVAQSPQAHFPQNGATRRLHGRPTAPRAHRSRRQEPAPWRRSGFRPGQGRKRSSGMRHAAPRRARPAPCTGLSQCLCAASGRNKVNCMLTRLGAVAGTRNNAYTGVECETVLSEGSRRWRGQAVRQGSRGGRQPHNHFGEAGEELRQDGRPRHGRRAPLLRLVGQAPVRDNLRGAQPASAEQPARGGRPCGVQPTRACSSTRA